MLGSEGVVDPLGEFITDPLRRAADVDDPLVRAVVLGAEEPECGVSLDEPHDVAVVGGVNLHGRGVAVGMWRPEGSAEV